MIRTWNCLPNLWLVWSRKHEDRSMDLDEPYTGSSGENLESAFWGFGVSYHSLIRQMQVFKKGTSEMLQLWCLSPMTVAYHGSLTERDPSGGASPPRWLNCPQINSPSSCTSRLPLSIIPGSSQMSSQFLGLTPQNVRWTTSFTRWEPSTVVCSHLR